MRVLLAVAFVSSCIAADESCPGVWGMFFEENKDKAYHVVSNWLSAARDYTRDKTAETSARVAGAVIGTTQAAVVDPARSAGEFVSNQIHRVGAWSRSDISWEERLRNMALKCKHLWIERNRDTWSRWGYSPYAYYDKHFKQSGGRGPCGEWMSAAFVQGAAKVAGAPSTMRERVCATLRGLADVPMYVENGAEMPSDEKTGLAGDLRSYYANVGWSCGS